MGKENTPEEIMAIIDIECRSEREYGFDRIAMRIARFPEVSHVSVVSGRSDLTVILSHLTMEKLSKFVTDTLASMEGIRSTSTQIFMKTYKKDGIMVAKEPIKNRLPVAA